jgi:hypothetical protein
MSLTRVLRTESVSPSSSRRFDVVRGLFSLTPESLKPGSCPWPRLARPSWEPAVTGTELPVWDIVDEWGVQSFPASDPPANW